MNEVRNRLHPPPFPHSNASLRSTCLAKASWCASAVPPPFISRSLTRAQPHEDGPAYHPVVATLSLGAHTVMHYYRYTPGGDGAVDSTPVLSLLLEPRSLVITSGALYTNHLHGIDARTDDKLAGEGGTPDDVPGVAVVGSGDIPNNTSSTPPPPGVHEEMVAVYIANAAMLGSEAARSAVRSRQTLVRETRYSLTCRDVSRVAAVGPARVFGRKQ